MRARGEHWDDAYRAKSADQQSWFEASPDTSLALIERAAPGLSSRIVDIGGGASRLVDSLLARGYAALTLLDVSAVALSIARARLGDAADRVRWVQADVTSSAPAGPFDVWHDRAVFHFLTEQADRDAYVAALERALPPGGHAIIATFAPDGPERCSGLPVCRYSAESLRDTLGGAFELLESRRARHVTPAGREQRFVYALFARR